MGPGPLSRRTRAPELSIFFGRLAITEAASRPIAPSPSLPCPRPRPGGRRHPSPTMALKRIHKVSGRRSAVGSRRFVGQQSKLRPALPAVSSAELAASSDPAAGDVPAGRPSQPTLSDGAGGGPGPQPVGRRSAHLLSVSLWLLLQALRGMDFQGLSPAWDFYARGPLSRHARRGGWGVGRPLRQRSKGFLAPSLTVLLPSPTYPGSPPHA